MYRQATTIAAAILALAAVTAPRQAEASESPAPMGSLAKKVVELLKAEKQTSVALGELTGPASLLSSSGAGLQAQLVAELSAKEIKVDPKSSYSIEGEYFPNESNDKEDLSIRIVLKVRAKSGKLIKTISEDVAFNTPGNNETMVKMLALQIDLSKMTRATQEDRNREIRRQMGKPMLKIDDGKVKTTAASPYSVEVLVRGELDKEFKLATPTDRGGKGNAFVELKRGDTFKLRLHNGSKIEAAVNVTIDGVDVFQFFEPANRRPRSFLIATNSNHEVKGWLRDMKSVNEFQFGSFGDSAAAKGLKSNPKLGTIVVCFHACWTGRTAPPEYGGSRSVEPNGSGLGKENKGSIVQPRTIGPLVASIVVRFNK